MLKIRIIPFLDVKNGRVVKGINFKNLKDAGDPVLTAQAYDELGADEICFLDIAATLENRDVTVNLVRKTAEKCFIPITVGGGIRTIEDIRHLLLNGADKVSFNSAAIRDPDIISTAANKFGSQCIVVALDAKIVSENNWEIFTHGGRNSTGINVVEFSKKISSLGAGEILLTSMDKDGTKSGYDNSLLKAVSHNIPIPVIASGGVGNVDDLINGVKIGGASAVLAASIFHFGEIPIKLAKEQMSKAGISVRL